MFITRGLHKYIEWNPQGYSINIDEDFTLTLGTSTLK